MQVNIIIMIIVIGVILRARKRKTHDTFLIWYLKTHDTFLIWYLKTHDTLLIILCYFVKSI